MKIIFFGDSEFSEPTRQKLSDSGYSLTVMGKKSGSLKDEKFFEYFKGLDPDLCIVADYGQIIPSRYLDIPKYGFINIHPSLLPKYRGPSPIHTAILNGDAETGVTIIKVDDEVDHGPILASREFSILNLKFSKYKEIEKELAQLGADLLIETLPKYINGQITPREQDHSQATYTKKLIRVDGRIDWNNSAEKIYNQIRTLSDEPGTWTFWRDKILNIKLAEVLEKDITQEPGTITSVDNQIAVATGKCYLILRRIQLEGKNGMDIKSFVNGHREFLGSKLV